MMRYLKIFSKERIKRWVVYIPAVSSLSEAHTCEAAMERARANRHASGYLMARHFYRASCRRLPWLIRTWDNWRLSFALNALAERERESSRAGPWLCSAGCQLCPSLQPLRFFPVRLACQTDRERVWSPGGHISHLLGPFGFIHQY